MNATSAPLKVKCSQTFFSYKTALPLALVSAKRVGELHALSVHPSCIQFSQAYAKVTLRLNAAFVPTVSIGYSYPVLHALFHGLSLRRFQERFAQQLTGVASYYYIIA